MGNLAIEDTSNKDTDTHPYGNLTASTKPELGNCKKQKRPY